MRGLAFVSASVCLAGIGSLAYANETQLQVWKVPGSMARVLVQAAAEVPEIRITGNLDRELIDELSSSCEMRVHRPTDVTVSTASEDNTLSCEVYDGQGQQARLEYDLRAVPFQTWGNRASEAYSDRHNLYKPYQVLNDRFNVALYRALLAQRKNNHPMVEDLFACDPNGVDCINVLSLMVDSNERYRPAYLNCSVNAERQTVYSTRCVFHFPEQ